MGTYYEIVNITQRKKINPHLVAPHGAIKKSEICFHPHVSKLLAYMMLGDWYHDHVVFWSDHVEVDEDIVDITKRAVEMWNSDPLVNGEPITLRQT